MISYRNTTNEPQTIQLVGFSITIPPAFDLIEDAPNVYRVISTEDAMRPFLDALGQRATETEKGT